MHRTLVLLAAVFALGAAPEPVESSRTFGADLTTANRIVLADLVAHPERYEAEPVQLEGRLTDLCTKKGCWTVLADGDQHVRVTFLDYGFFLPPDALGARAIIEGIAEVRTLSEGEARHIASESRNGDPDAVQGPVRQIGFVASGVRLLGAGPTKTK